MSPRRGILPRLMAFLGSITLLGFAWLDILSHAFQGTPLVWSLHHAGSSYGCEIGSCAFEIGWLDSVFLLVVTAGCILTSVGAAWKPSILPIGALLVLVSAIPVAAPQLLAYRAEGWLRLLQAAGTLLVFNAVTMGSVAAAALYAHRATLGARERDRAS